MKKIAFLMLTLIALHTPVWAASDKSLDAVRKAAEQGDAEAQHSLGLAYFDGQGVSKDLAEAAKWFRKAAEKGLSNAQYMLGVTYLVSENAPKDYVEATKWFRCAAEQGYVDAQSMLGAAYATGKGVPKDYVLAYMWSNIAAAHGDKDASDFRDDVARKMTPEEIAQAKGLAQAWKPNPQAK